MVDSETPLADEPWHAGKDILKVKGPLSSKWNAAHGLPGIDHGSVVELSGPPAGVDGASPAGYTRNLFGNW